MPEVSMPVPALHGDGVTLRPFLAADVPTVIEAGTDPLIPLITTVPTTGRDDDALAFVHRQWGRARDGVGCSFAIAVPGTSAAVGQLGVWPLRDGRASVGYWITPSQRGRGHAAGALRLLTGWAFPALDLARPEAYVEPWNVASIRTVERAGFQREGLLRQWQRVGDQRKDMVMFSLLATDPSPSVETQAGPQTGPQPGPQAGTDT